MLRIFARAPAHFKKALARPIIGNYKLMGLELESPNLDKSPNS